MRSVSLAALLLLAAMCGGCNFSPKSQPPPMEVPPHFKEKGTWTIAKPAAHLPHRDWWTIFHDDQLNAIMHSVEVNNQSLQSTAAKAEETAALLKAAKLAFLPTATVDSASTRSKNSAEGVVTNGNSVLSTGPGVQSLRSVTGSSSWEIDLWGQLRHSARAATADTEAALADVETARLSLLLQAAQTYFTLRSTDTQYRLLEGEVANYQKSLDLTKNREVQGVASSADIALAETQLATTRASMIDLKVQRATLEHALATLTGRPPAAFDLKEATLTGNIPSLPPALPSTLLERRPDIAAAECRVAAANERIGAARAAFFPTLTLTADYGWSGLANLFAAPNSFWSQGANLAEPLLDSGQRIAAKAQADATWKQVVADYRQTVLSALQEAEDALATLRVLAQESVVQDDAVRAARESERITLNQYKAGTLSYLNVATAQALALAAEINAINVQSRRLNATVGLLKALAGGW